jgi:hypothetical protein
MWWNCSELKLEQKELDHRRMERMFLRRSMWWWTECRSSEKRYQRSPSTTRMQRQIRKWWISLMCEVRWDYQKSFKRPINRCLGRMWIWLGICTMFGYA